MKRLVVLLASFFIGVYTFAQEDTTSLVDVIDDTLSIAEIEPDDFSEVLTDTVIFTQFNSNLDKLVQLWYVQKSEYWKYCNRPLLGYDSSYVPSFTPEEYKQRIAKMNSIIPLSYNDQVQAFINVYAFRKRDRVEIMLGLAEYYFPMFEEILDKYEIPLELKYLAIIESALNPRATSPVGAGGLWQFMPGTGVMYKLHITSFVDDRRDPYKSTHAAAKYLKSLYGMFNDWLLAIAAYNCGPGNVRKAITRSGGKTNFWEIYPYLPRETRGYVPAFIAAYYVFENHAEHNLYPREIAFPRVTDTIMVTQQLHLQQVSEVLNIPLQFLQDINPQYRVGIIPASEKGHALYLPIDYVTPFLLFQDSILTYKDSLFFDPTVISKSAVTDKHTFHSTTSCKGKVPVYYFVKKGDNLNMIANWYDVSVQDIKTWNKLSSNSIAVDKKLTIYVPANKKDYYAKITTMSLAQKQKLGSAPVTQNVVAKPESTTHKKNTYTYHTVKKGETLWAISQKYDNVSLDDILQMNGLTTKSKITPGMKLKIKTM
ncbi:MAG TPA: transglycosylase SLT domain-containing protein [Bacteroidales bacterium]|jgi:membrane-bound lytic murein transglycosylase D|nr:transglycosylase SLT domain-containing protein [Bacteroidales bacterium]